MKLIRFILLFSVLHPAIHSFAQQKGSRQSVQKKAEPEFNRMDKYGKPTGMWWISVPEHLGEPAYNAFGNYDHGRKTGIWYKMDSEGELMAVETYKNNVLDGEVKYYDQGRLSCIGHYRGLNPKNNYDTVIIIDPVTQYEMLKAIANDKGTQRHGMWQYYDPITGQLIREQEYQVDNLIYEKSFINERKDDTAYYARRNENLPHNKKIKLPAGKPVSYLIR